jgi:hypothetical protein
MVKISSDSMGEDFLIATVVVRRATCARVHLDLFPCFRLIRGGPGIFRCDLGGVKGHDERENELWALGFGGHILCPVFGRARMHVLVNGLQRGELEF